ncbi:hypothetical protein BO70DRAFT_283616 [Aspergillus heteromorphus CBS 117.55]|uniref:Zn(2)-C6 fungal-type domain-containing protein n=1 Tax=Aspergillus heteromorphus CBS 117.55 TaxID=1448321 RepID=A0A317WX07_9EURO|nr:uncharacterized protein BO70DRAFT_283616 [Aspergillus heteromorphus CBS 117.55]PWY90946.1 hypothetical protein BO70DRAFT_283616 [Aspergillus heteromorphus CBS 117.55]
MQESSDSSAPEDPPPSQSSQPSQLSQPSQPSSGTNHKIAIPRLAPSAVKTDQQRTARACVACRTRKTKCDGHRPVCRQCHRLNFTCSYAGSKRERQQLELESARTRIASYESLLRDVLAESSRQRIASFETIFDQHFESAPDAFATLQAARSLPDQHVSSPQPGISLHRMHVTLAGNPRNNTPHTLSDAPLVTVTNIQFWTDLVDNTIASHLLSIYFAWENPTWHLIDQEMFVRDLESGRTRFCSALLVHILLFFGCVIARHCSLISSYHLGRVTDRREEKILGKKLYDSLQCLWHADQYDPGLPAAQSSIMIGLLCCTFGLDRLGTKYIMMGAELTRRLGLHCASAPYFTSDVEDEVLPLSRCHKLVATGVFDVQALAAQVYRKPASWLHPPAASFSQEEAAALDDGLEWAPYPFATPVFRPFFYTVTWARNGLVEIVNELAAFALKFPDAVMNTDDWVYGCQLYQRLRQWRASLPSIILPEGNRSPSILTLQMYYQATIVSLAETFNLNSPPTLTPPPPADPTFDPPALKLQSLEHIGSLILLFQTVHGLKTVPIVMLHYFCVGGVHSVSQLSASDPKWSLILESCVVGLWHLSLGWGRLCTAFLRTIELVMLASKPDPTLISPRVTAVLEQLKSKRWSEKDVESLAADYVVYHVPVGVLGGEGEGGEFRAQGLESLIKSLRGFSVD